MYNHPICAYTNGTGVAHRLQYLSPKARKRSTRNEPINARDTLSVAPPPDCPHIGPEVILVLFSQTEPFVGSVLSDVQRLDWLTR